MYQNLMPLRFIHDYYYFYCVVLCFIEDSCFSKDLWLRIGKDSPENFPTKKKGFKTVVSEKFGRVLALLLLTATYILLASVQFPKSHMIRQAQNNNQKNSCKCMLAKMMIIYDCTTDLTTRSSNFRVWWSLMNLELI